VALRHLIRRIQRSWAVDAVLFSAVILGLVGMFFRQEISDLLRVFLDDLIAAYNNFGKTNNDGPSFTDLLTPKNLLIAVFIVGFLAIVWRRIVWRLRNSRSLTSPMCPKCSHPLSRIRRSQFHKIVSVLLPVRRYYCHNCHWKGVRIKSYTSDDGNIKGIRLKSGPSGSLSF
jgi:phosphoglycerol transferase MdoB-like AlkP superfamily enzyme